MAESSIVKNIDEVFCQCSICLDQFKDPKLLPCLHRFCGSKCLEQLIQDAHGVGILKCPECREECEIPADGVDGFKTDFYMKSMVDFVTLQKSLQDEQIRECYNCAKTGKASAYCFKCSDFFCEECHIHHVTSKMMKDHRSHTLSLDDVKSKNISFEKLVSLKNVPRCPAHLENISQLCCTTCGNLPICVACSFGRHKDHFINDVTSLASTQRDRLTGKVACLQGLKEKLDNMKDKVTKTEELIKSNASVEKEKFQSRHADKTKDIETKRKTIYEQICNEKLLAEKNGRERLAILHGSMDKEIQDIKDKYDKLFTTEKMNIASGLQELQDKLENAHSQLDEKLVYLNQRAENFMKSIDNMQADKLNKSKEIAQHYKNVTKRYENLTDTTNSIMFTKDDWTAVSCIPDIFLAIDPLIEDLNREFPELGKLEAFDIVNTSLKDIEKAESVCITKYKEHVINVKDLISKDSTVLGIKGVKDNVVLTGLLGEGKEFFCAFNLEGKVLLMKTFQQVTEDVVRSYASLSSCKRAVGVCTKAGIVSFCAPDGLYKDKSIKLVIPNWEPYQEISFIGFNSCGDLMFYLACKDGKNKQVVFVDEKLELKRTFKLPPAIKGVVQIDSYEDKLLVSNFTQKCVHGLSMEGDILYDFNAPVEGNWRPVDVSVDNRGFIYILMLQEFPESVNEKKSPSGKGVDNKCMDRAKVILVQYSQDGNRVLAIRRFNETCLGMAIVKTKHGEKLLLLLSSLEIHVFGLMGNE